MNLLLDTHIWLWSLLEPGRLPAHLRTALEEEGHDLWLSPISVWETLMLAERGRLQLAPDPESWVRNQIATSPITEAPLTSEVAIESRAVALPHNDPADRFLAATARVYELTLVTADARLLAIPGLSVLTDQ